MDELRASVRRSLPEVEMISDKDLANKVVEAWALCLSQSEFTSIDDILGSGGPDTSPMRDGTQTHHIRGVARMALGLAEQLESVTGSCGIDRDLLLACALCHDVGKPYEYSPANQKRWSESPGASGFPAIRHSVYGVHICLTVGLPEAVAHTAGAHSREGNFIMRSLENTIVYFADHAFWAILERAERLEPLADGRIVT
ncbi:HD domain-containing protein [Devosia sp. YIM 151766]|uniref:HD domain-containing protein n=1 Tax=Devosia sp. YIM 151766 TaxID=3017325 RepID=UPI00255C4070|nr:HD domain-containing protein [Devosia sp. YIM 151766]WIY53555.1 HD domain-containing protein [Devosia sp. YIM 151766]